MRAAGLLPRRRSEIVQGVATLGNSGAARVTRSGHGTLDERLERNLYSKLKILGPALTGIIDLPAHANETDGTPQLSFSETPFVPDAFSRTIAAPGLLRLERPKISLGTIPHRPRLDGAPY